EQTIQILQAVDPAILADASFDMDLLDELALDPRAYDQSHPAGRPRNYIFGEWDQHHLDDQGRYRRFVVRGVVLEALLERVENQESGLRGQKSGIRNRAPGSGLPLTPDSRLLTPGSEALFE